MGSRTIASMLLCLNVLSLPSPHHGCRYGGRSSCIFMTLSCVGSRRECVPREGAALSVNARLECGPRRVATSALVEVVLNSASKDSGYTTPPLLQPLSHMAEFAELESQM